MRHQSRRTGTWCVAGSFILTLTIQAQGAGGQTPGCPPGPGPHRWYVDGAAVNGANDGSSWADAFLHLQDALVRAHICDGADEVWVAAGTYYPDRTTPFPEGDGDPEATFERNPGVSVYGGFLGLDHPGWPGGETELSQRDPENNVTILSGDIAGNTQFPPPHDTYHVVTAENGDSGLLDGFTIESGDAWDGAGGSTSSWGARRSSAALSGATARRAARARTS